MARDPMSPDLKIMEPATLAEAVSQACIEAALAAYEDVSCRGVGMCRGRHAVAGFGVNRGG